MRHLDDGTVRRMHDEPHAMTGSQRRHYDECPRCQERYVEIAGSADETARLFAAPSPRVDSVAALEHVRRRFAADHVASGSTLRNHLSWMREVYGRRFARPAAGLGAAAVLIGATALTPAGSLAQKFITIFQPTQVAAVPVTSSDLRTLPDLRKYGTVHAPAKVSDLHAASPAEASQLSGMAVLTPATLPTDVPAQVKYDVVPSTTGSFTFSAAKTRKTLLTLHAKVRSMPRQIDGSTLQVKIGTGVIATYGGGQSQSDIPSLVIGQMQAPVVSSTGVSVKEVEDYVLGLPGVSPQLARAIKSINSLDDPASTLLLPVPVDLANSHAAQVQGVQGLAIGDATGLGSVVIWQKNGVLYGVGGPLKESEILAIADSLH